MDDHRDLERRVRELERLLPRLIQVGVVSEVFADEKRVRVEIGGRESHKLRFVTQRAGDDRAWGPPSEGEQVLVFAPNGDVVAAVVGGSLYQQDFDAPSDDPDIKRTVYANGTEVELDKDSGVLRVKHPGAVEVEAEGDVSITAGGTLSLTGETVRINE